MPLITQPIEIAVTAPNSNGPSGGARLPIGQVFQAATNLCWAACVQMVLNHKGLSAQQGDIANKEFNQTICDLKPDDPNCNRPLSIPDIAAAYALWGVSVLFVGYATAFDYLESEIAVGRPVEVGFDWNGEGTHVALVVGTGTDTYGPLAYVNDPYYGDGWVYFVNIQRAYNLGSWQWTWGSIA